MSNKVTTYNEEPAQGSDGEASHQKSQQDDSSPKSWKYYLHPNQVTLLMHRKWDKFGLVAGFYYLTQFVMCVAVCNFYGDVSRYYICQREDMSYIRGEEASAVYDLALYMTGVFHVVEWIRATILLVVIFVGVNLMHVWYASALSSIYGLVCLVIVHIAAFSEDG